MAKGYLSRGIARSSSVSDSGPQVLFHDHWPIGHEDFPVVTVGSKPEDPRHDFAAIESDSIGFYPIVPRASWVRPLAELGVKTIQLRIKDLSGDLLECEIADAITAAKSSGTQLFINDYWELALKYGAFGVHLGQEDLASADVTRLRLSGIRLGISTHSYFEAAVAHGIRPSYIALGPIFPTTCKSMRFGPQGFERVKEWRRMLPYPLVAIGGLSPEHRQRLKECGAEGFAVISDWLHHANPMIRVQEWLRPIFS
jgi:hydroxymethylpyrimidine kinase/phosphomethylpyrimidine kinase/thiamine-phosphate diphosphorylase